ncbi:MAG: hypothetical protein ACYCW6_09385 [Candidatus Xenobia bacterium]
MRWLLAMLLALSLSAAARADGTSPLGVYYHRQWAAAPWHLPGMPATMLRDSAVLCGLLVGFALWRRRSQ